MLTKSICTRKWEELMVLFGTIFVGNDELSSHHSNILILTSQFADDGKHSSCDSGCAIAMLRYG
jgi:hypothetical protein